MTYHLRSCHTHDKPYLCQECKCIFSLEANLNTHQRIRHNVKETDSTSKPGLMYHKLSHTGNRPFKCMECGKGFKISTNLSLHKNVHSRERPHICK